MSSIKKNYIYNLIYTISGLLFPIITFPYASRIMLADGIGEVNFFSSIVAYISLFTSLGIPLYAIREIAKVRNDNKLLNKTTVEIFFLHIILTVLGYVVVAILSLTVSKISENISLFLIISTTIVFTTIGCEWFYQGVEDFKYIVVRGLFVRIVAVVLLFVLVKDRSDLLWYGLYTVIGTVGGNVYNFVRLRKYINVKSIELRNIDLIRHFKPVLHIFLLNVIVSIYVNLDTIMLGFLKDNTAVGYYTAATKLSKMVLSVSSSLGIVLLPRLSNLIATQQKDSFISLANKATSCVLMLASPFTVALIIMAPCLINVFCGISYEPAILTLQIISPIILFIGLSGIIGMQILYPQGKENLVIISTAIGAALNFFINYLLIPIYAQNGAAIATLIAEFMVVSIMIFIGRKYNPVKLMIKSNMHYIIGSAIMGGVLWGVSLLNLSDLQILPILFLSGAVSYISYLVIVRERLFFEFIMQIVSPLRIKADCYLSKQLDKDREN